MYVTPRPDINEDPNYAVRLGLIGVLAYAAIPIINPALPPIIAALPVGLIAAQRRAFSPIKAIAAPIVMIVLVYVMTWFVEQLRPMPGVYVGAMWLTYYIGFRLILGTGTQVGMLIIIIAVLMSVMGRHGNATVETMRDGCVQAALVALVIAPIVYLLIPAHTKEPQVDQPVPSPGNVDIGAMIRATVLLGLSMWLYSVMQPSDMMMAMVAAMVIVFPTKERVWDEAFQRIRATFYGAASAGIVLWIFAFVPRLPLLLGMVFLTGLYMGSKMLFGRQQSMVYQYAYSVMLSLVAGALSTQEAGYATFTRVVLTLGGAFAAAFAVALLDSLTQWRSRGPDRPKAGA